MSMSEELSQVQPPSCDELCIEGNVSDKRSMFVHVCNKLELKKNFKINNFQMNPC